MSYYYNFFCFFQHNKERKNQPFFNRSPSCWRANKKFYYFYLLPVEVDGVVVIS